MLFCHCVDRHASASLWLQCSLQCWNDLERHCVITGHRGQSFRTRPDPISETSSWLSCWFSAALQSDGCASSSWNVCLFVACCISSAVTTCLTPSLSPRPSLVHFSSCWLLLLVLRVTAGDVNHPRHAPDQQGYFSYFAGSDAVQKVSRCRRTGGEMGSTLVFFKSKLQFVLSQDSLLTDLHLWSAVSDISAGSEVIYAVNVATGREDEEIWETTAQSSVITNCVGDICLFKES